MITNTNKEQTDMSKQLPIFGVTAKELAGIAVALPLFWGFMVLLLTI